MGFSVPLADWLRTELKETTEERLFNRTEGLTQYFKPEAIKKMWDEHQDKSVDHSSPLWSMLMFQMWWDKYMSNEQTLND
jgi:asparagine synthase (glutamine-hydrolysing)